MQSINLECDLDYRRPLFQLEQWSPSLARRFWGLRSFRDAPFALALGLKVGLLSDLNVEIQIPVTPLNKDELDRIRPSILVAAGEFASRLLWQRHLDPQSDRLELVSIQCRFLKPARSRVKARAELVEVERESLLRKIRSGGEAEFDMPVVFFDENDQQIANLNGFWRMRPVGPMSLEKGRSS